MAYIDLKTIRRFYQKVDFAGGFAPAMETECWRWTAKTGKGRSGSYGRFWDGTYLPAGSPRFVQAHRFAYELIVGPIPAGLQLDHGCHVHQCVNPNHLEPVTQSVNAQRCKGAYVTNKSSGVRGVTWHRKTKKWQVTVQSGSTKNYGGLFADLQEAARAAVLLREATFGVDEVRMDYRVEGIAR